MSYVRHSRVSGNHRNEPGLIAPAAFVLAQESKDERSEWLPASEHKVSQACTNGNVVCTGMPHSLLLQNMSREQPSAPPPSYAEAVVASGALSPTHPPAEVRAEGQSAPPTAPIVVVQPVLLPAA